MSTNLAAQESMNFDMPPHFYEDYEYLCEELKILFDDIKDRHIQLQSISYSFTNPFPARSRFLILLTPVNTAMILFMSIPLMSPYYLVCWEI